MSDLRYPALSRVLGRSATLDDIPDAELDRLVSTFVDLRNASIDESDAQICL
jgi:hypothetical protein